MTVLKRRNRMIAFRISEEEYERACRVCLSLGARSVSGLARSAINRLIGCENDAGDPLIGQLQLLSREMEQLKTTVDELSSRLVESEGGRSERHNAIEFRKTAGAAPGIGAGK